MKKALLLVSTLTKRRCADLGMCLMILCACARCYDSVLNRDRQRLTSNGDVLLSNSAFFIFGVLVV